MSSGIPVLRIGISVPRLGFQGGLERHAFDLARALAARGHFVRLLHGPARGQGPEEFAAAFSETAPLAVPGALRGLDVAWVEKAADAEELERFGALPLVIAVHDHDLTCARTSRMLLVGGAPCERAPGLACVGHGCAVVRDRRPGALPLRVRNPLSLPGKLRALARRAPLVACSAFVARTLIEAGAPAERVSAIHPVPPDESGPLVPRPSAPRFLVAAQLVAGKGVELAVRALALLGPEVALDVAGDGPERAALERLARPLGARVRFHGYVEPAQMTALYDRASAVLVPSRWPEPFGLVGVEAMRRARPVAAAAHGGVTEWLPQGRGGAAFAPGDVAALARAAASLLADPAAGDAALAWVRARFPHSRAVDEAEQALHAALAGHSTTERSAAPGLVQRATA